VVVHHGLHVLWPHCPQPLVVGSRALDAAGMGGACSCGHDSHTGVGAFVRPSIGLNGMWTVLSHAG
jgi:hypothetical protein